MEAVLSRVVAGNANLRGVDPRLVPLLDAALSPYPEERPTDAEIIEALETYAVVGRARRARGAGCPPSDTGPGPDRAATAAPGADLSSAGTAGRDRVTDVGAAESHGRGRVLRSRLLQRRVLAR